MFKFSFWGCSQKAFTIQPPPQDPQACSLYHWEFSENKEAHRTEDICGCMFAWLREQARVGVSCCVNRVIF